MSWASVRRAQHALQIIPQESKGDPQGPWVWTLPGQGVQPSPIENVEHLEHLPFGAFENADFEGSESAETPEDAQPRCVSTFDQIEHLAGDDPTLGGLVNPGWSAKAWAGELERKADCCERTNPDLAADYRRRAAAIRAAIKLVLSG